VSVYEGELNAEKLVNFAFDVGRTYTFTKIGMKVPKKKVEEKIEEVEDDDDVIVLDDDTMESMISNS
jgi:ribosomal protein L15